MLIIFDLDDTLIDTSRCITPIKLKSAFFRMKEMGCSIREEEAALHRLLALNDRALTAQEALRSFVEEFGIDDSFFYIGMQELYGPLAADFFVPPIDGAVELLSLLKQEHDLAIVSIGKKEQQMHKLKKAGIDFSFFYKILCVEEGSKKNSYEVLMKEKKYLPSEVVVCGDKIPVDLIPAKELGCRTVHMKRGRGLYSTGPIGTVDFVATHLLELPQMIAQVKEQNIRMKKEVYGDK